MKKLLSLVCIAALLFATTAFGFEFKKENVQGGVEYNALESDIADKHLVTITTPGTSAEIYGAISDFKTKETLANIGYNLSDTLKPYILLGAVNVKCDYRLSGKINKGTLDVLSSSINSTALAYGFGITGDLVKFGKGPLLSYDIRRLASRSDENFDTNVIGRLSAPTDAKIHYAKWETTVLLSQELKVQNKILAAITPFVGYKYSNIDVDLTQNMQLAPKVNTNLDFSANGSNNSILVGAKVKLTKNIDAVICGSMLDEKGIMSKVVIHF